MKMKSRRHPPTRRPLAFPPAIETTVKPVGVLRHGARGLAAQHTQKAVAREARRRGLPEHRQAWPVERREPRTRQERGVQSRDVGEAEERLRRFLDRLEVEERDRLRGAVAAAHRLDRVDLGIREGRLQVCGPHLRAAAVPVLALERARHELHAVALLLPPGDAALDLGPRLRRAPRSDDADRGSRRRRTTDQAAPA